MAAPETLETLGEFGLLSRLDTPRPQHVMIGRGDDAAQVAQTGDSYLISTDILVENRHFRRDWSSAYDIGRKAAAVNLSDINAMGGRATAMTVAFAAPPGTEVAWAADLHRGLVDEADVVGAALVGGDISAAGEIVISVTVTGHATRAVTRGGAEPGDVVAVTGDLGWAGAGFATLSRGFRSPRAAVERHRVPVPPYAAGPQAADAGATAMIDVSDGLVGDLGHIAAASGVRIELDSAAFTIPEPVATVGEALGVDPLSFVLAGGDDYALAATFGSEASVPEGWTVVGRVNEGGDVLVDGVPYEERPSHQHFR